MTNNYNVKFKPGKFYCLQNSDYEIEIIGIVAGYAIVKGWKISHERIRIDEQNNEYIRIENKTYCAYCKA